MDPWWNPATEAQAVDRVHRIRQIRKVDVYRLVAKDTKEDEVMALKASKSALISSVLDAGDLSSGALDESDIRFFSSLIEAREGVLEQHDLLPVEERPAS